MAPLLCSLSDTLYGPDKSGRPAAGDIKACITYCSLCRNCCYSAQLSVLSGATHLAPHHGLINTKLRAHLPLLIPTDPAPVLVVAGQNITWTEGKMFLFDDTYEHEVSFALSNQPSLKCFISLYISSEINLWYKSELTGQVIHESDAQRIVLLIDLHHPELSEERRRL